MSENQDTIDSLRTRLQAAERERDEAREMLGNERAAHEESVGRLHGECGQLLLDLNTERAAHAETRRALEVERAVIAEIALIGTASGDPLWCGSTGAAVLEHTRRRIAERAQKGAV
jgi:hypothetical protein